MPTKWKNAKGHEFMISNESDRRRRARNSLGLNGAFPYPPANIGQNHPDYGMSVGEHERAKAIRNEKANGTKTMPKRFGTR